MSGMKWLEEKAEDSAPMETYMDTCEQSKNENTRNSLKSWWARQDLNLRPDDYESVYGILYWIPPSNIN